MGVLVRILIKLFVWLAASLGVTWLSTNSQVWSYVAGRASSVIEPLQGHINSISTIVPVLPATEEFQKICYTLEQGGWHIRSFLVSMAALWTFYITLLGLRLVWRTMSMIRGA